MQEKIDYSKIIFKIKSSIKEHVFSNEISVVKSIQKIINNVFIKDSSDLNFQSNFQNLYSLKIENLINEIKSTLSSNYNKTIEYDNPNCPINYKHIQIST